MGYAEYLYQDWPVTGIPEDPVLPVADILATSNEDGALPVIVPVYNAPDRPAQDLQRMVRSVALSSFETGHPARPLLVINGHPEGQALDMVRQLGLQEDTQYMQIEGAGKVRAVQAGVQRLLETEGHRGAFAMIDDDVVVPRRWLATVVGRMNKLEIDAVGGGTIRYHHVPGVPRAVLAARNVGNAVKEWQAARQGELRAHGSNMWLTAYGDAIIRAVAELDPTVGYGDDAVMVQQIKEMGGLVLPTDLGPDGRVVTAGDRTKTWRDLVHTLVGSGGVRYTGDESWQTQYNLPLPSER